MIEWRALPEPSNDAETIAVAHVEAARAIAELLEKFLSRQTESNSVSFFRACLRDILADHPEWSEKAEFYKELMGFIELDGAEQQAAYGGGR